jgi:hypothetical protein
MRSIHQQRVELFMHRAKQEVHPLPCIPSIPTRILRARLTLEEALELINALGCTVHCNGTEIRGPEQFMLEPCLKPNLLLVADGTADLSVINTGTMSSCGLPDIPLLSAVDANNLNKFGPGHSFRADGKLIKPPGHRPLNFIPILELFGYKQS